MKKSIRNRTTRFLFTTLYIVAGATFAGNALGADDAVLWKSGPHLVFKYMPQDNNSLGPNDHPVELAADDIKTALESLTVEEESFLTSDKQIVSIFSVGQLQLLGTNLAKGLKNAKPNQDIVFVMERSSRKLLLMKEKAFVSGRAFYQDGKLNLLIGDYDLARNDTVEALYGGAEKGEAVPYNFNYGFRSKANSDFRKTTLKVDGVENKIANGQLRKNWFVIDVKTAAAAYLANKNQRGTPGETVNNEAMQREAERLARERRQLRLEMAKMRKEMQEGATGTGTGSGQLTIEERLGQLDALHEKQLITDAEYEQKRREILDDI